MDIELLDNNFKDKELEKVLNLYTNLHVFLKGSKDIDKALKTRFATGILEGMGEILSSRFGLNIKLKTDLACGACTLSLQTGHNTNIGRNSADWKKQAENALKRGVTSKEKEFLQGYLDTIKYTRESFVKGVSVDLKKAKVYGLNRKAISVIYLDFNALIGLFNLKPREVIGVLLHEVGHNFTSLMYMHKTSGNSLSHEESLAKWLGGDTDKMYIKIGDKDVDLRSRGSAKLITEDINNSLKVMKHTFSDSEREADRFATSFGFGKDLVSALAVMHNIDPERSFFFRSNSSLRNIIFGSLYLAVFMPLYVAYALSAGVIIDSIIIGLLSGIFYLLAGTGDSNDTVYDDVPARLKKIKRNMVRSIRENLVPKDQVNMVIDSIEAVEAHILTLNIDASLSESLYNYFNKTANTTKLFETLEALSENDLHYLKERI